MKAYLIKPDAEEIEIVEVPVPKGDNYKPQLDALYKHLKIDKGSKLVEQVRCARLDKRWQKTMDVLLIDEEGRMRPATQKLGLFTLWGFKFIGRGIILSEKRGKDGATWAEPTMTIDDLKRALNWIKPRETEPELDDKPDEEC